MATQDGFHLPARVEVTRATPMRTGAPFARLAAPLCAAMAVLLLAAPAEARRHKRKPPPPAAKPAPPPEPKPEPKPAAKPAAAEPVVTGPALTVVGVSLDAQGLREAALAAYLGEQATRRAGKQKLLPLEDLLDPEGAAARAKAEAEGDRDLATAKRAYFNDLDLDTAAAFCDRAYAAFLKSDLPRDFSKLVEASELKIAALAADPKKAALARAGLESLLPIDPRTELSPNLFNPDTIKVAEGIRQKLKAGATLSLEVRAGQVPARVFVDGSFRGIAPATVAHLAPGQHVVTLVAPGYQRAQLKVNPGTQPTLDQVLTPAPKLAAAKPRLEAVERSFHSDRLTAALADLGKALGVEQVLLLAPQAGPNPGTRELAAVRAAVTPPALLDDLDAPLPAEAGKAASATDALATQALSRDHLLQGHRVLLSSSRSSAAPGTTMTYAGYGLIGGGAVAAGLGTFFGLQAKSQQSKFRDLPQTDPSASSVASSGKTDALIANVAFGAALVAVGAGVAMVVMSHQQAEAPKRSTDVEPEPRSRPRPSSSAAPKPVERRPATSSAPSPTMPAAKPPPAAPAEQKKPEKKAEPKPEAKPAAPPPDDTKTQKPPKDLGEDIRDDE